jgi:RNA polymerase sigma factor (sigma-70 family)
MTRSSCIRDDSSSRLSDPKLVRAGTRRGKACSIQPCSQGSEKCGKRSGRVRASRELIERTRQLMERTIEFVPHEVFDRKNALDVLVALRPASLDCPPVLAQPEQAVAFVSGLVQAPLLTHDEERYLFTWMNFLKYRAERNRRQLSLNRPDQELIERIEADLKDANHARNHIVQGNVRLIVALAKKLSAALDQMSELISEGMTPLIRSVELFDISLGNRFSTYATWAVRNQMLRWLKRSRSSLELAVAVDSPSLENLADRRSETSATEASHQSRVAVVSQLLDTLPERERKVLAARFGLDGQPEGLSLADIADQIGLSKERVRQIALCSISKLRETISYDEFESLG